MVRDIYPFKSIIYTLYATQDSLPRSRPSYRRTTLTPLPCRSTRSARIHVAKLKQAGAVTYVHTINDTTTVNNYEKWGVYGVYSDLLTEPELEQNSLRYTMKK